MSVKLTKHAVLAIKDSMERNQLDLKRFALRLYSQNGDLSITFTDEIDGASVINELLFKVDEDVKSYHQKNPLVVDYVTNGEKKGLIFLEGNKHERYTN